MPNFSIPPMPPPIAPRENAELGEVSLWARRVSGYLTALNSFIEETADAYISNNAQLSTGIINVGQLNDSAVTTIRSEERRVGKECRL